MTLEISNPRQAIITSYNQSVLYLVIQTSPPNRKPILYK